MCSICDVVGYENDSKRGEEKSESYPASRQSKFVLLILKIMGFMLVPTIALNDSFIFRSITALFP